MFISRVGSIKALIGDLDVFENVTALLDLQENSWRRFGRKFEIPVDVLNSLRPDPIPSPTRVLMGYIVQNDPNLPMRSFVVSLEKIQRFDVIEELKGFFKRKTFYTWYN